MTDVATTTQAVATVAETAAQAPEGLKYIAIGLCALAMTGAALAIGNIFGSFFNSIARNPSAAPLLQKYIYIAAGMAEAIAIFALLLAFMM